MNVGVMKDYKLRDLHASHKKSEKKKNWDGLERGGRKMTAGVRAGGQRELGGFTAVELEMLAGDIC
jgi:hypothetical protein